jgi:Type IV secretion system pilin
MKFNILKRLITSLCLISLCLVASPSMAAANDLFVSGPGVDCSSGSSASTSAICSEHANTDNPLTGCPSNCGSGTLDKITNIIAYVAGAAAIIMVIVGAIRFVTSGSDTTIGNRIDDDVIEARRTIINALVGLAIVVLAKVLINYVILKLNP